MDEQFPAQSILQVAGDRADGYDAPTGDAIEAVGKGFFRSPTNIVYDGNAMRCCPYTERAHPIRVVQLQRHREVHISGKVRRDDAREVADDFQRGFRVLPDSFDRAVELLVIDIEVDERIDEEIRIVPDALAVQRFGFWERNQLLGYSIAVFRADGNVVR